MKNNIQLSREKLQVLIEESNVLQTRGQLEPGLNFSTTHTATTLPVAKNIFGDRNAYNSNYGLNASWTVWNGGRTQLAIKASELQKQIVETGIEITANNILEQIVNLYIQTLYISEAVQMTKDILELSEYNYKRGKEMVTVGLISKAELSQLSSQVSLDEYNLAKLEGQKEKYKMQLKLLLELDLAKDEFNDGFDIEFIDMEDMPELMEANGFYLNTYKNLPDYKQLGIELEYQKTQMQLAERSNSATVDITASFGASYTTAMDKAMVYQLRDGLNGAVGITLTVPITDKKIKKASVSKIKTSIYDVELKRKAVLHEYRSKVENYTLEAYTNCVQYEAAENNVQSTEESYRLLQEQFVLGLKNASELNQGKQSLIVALQNQIESKYMYLLYCNLLSIYKK